MLNMAMLQYISHTAQSQCTYQINTQNDEEIKNIIDSLNFKTQEEGCQEI